MLRQKIRSLKALRKIVSGLKAKGKRIAFTNGCFDLLHYGHVNYLEQAKAAADVLVVAVNSDSSVRKIKPKGRPLINEKDRIRTVAALESVDYALLFSEETPIRIIEALRPDVLVKGADWHRDRIVGGDLVRSYAGKVYRIKFVPNRSTTGLIHKIIKRFG